MKDIYGEETLRVGNLQTLCRLWLTITTSKQLWVGYGFFGCLEATTGTQDKIFLPPFSPNPVSFDSEDFGVSQSWLQWLRLDLTVTGFLLNKKVEIKRAENLFLVVNQHFIFY